MNDLKVTYYKLISDYKHDVTKNCGLTGQEVDTNFYFLRGYDIVDGYVDSYNNSLVFTRVNGDKLVVSGFSPTITFEGSSYDSDTSTLTLIANGEEYKITGFCNCSELTEQMNVVQEQIKKHECAIDELSETVGFLSEEIKMLVGKDVTEFFKKLEEIERKIEDLKELSYWGGDDSNKI